MIKTPRNLFALLQSATARMGDYFAGVEGVILRTRAAVRATTSFRCTDAAKIFHDFGPFEIERVLERSPSLAARLQ